MKSKTMNNICPVCGSERNEVLYEVSCDDSARHFIVNRKCERFSQLRTHLENLWGANSCCVLRCGDCGFSYANPYIGGDKKFYDLAYQRNTDAYPTWKFEFQETFNFLSSLCLERLEDFPVLEVGAGDGAFIRKLTEIVPSNFIWATEFSDYGAQQIRKLGVQVSQVDFREQEEWDNKFAAICLFQVLEHLDDIPKTFEAINRITRENAYLFIAVPNNKRIDFNESNGALLDMPPNHIGRYTENSFKVIAQKFGWTIEDYKIEPASLKSFLDEFALYKYLRNTQTDNSLDYLIESSRLLRKLFKNSRVAHLKKLYRAKIAMHYQEALGSSQWIALHKKSHE
ncbi:MAG: class I SAM-dependent methyltransferase [Stigonema ocellatum SAG 48.90 = DSM 106950]|nr:class I SAM-dependent methyltransferase [Stigonema ocellatum SAG 48.90 = DSM 106950]